MNLSKKFDQLVNNKFRLRKYLTARLRMRFQYYTFDMAQAHIWLWVRWVCSPMWQARKIEQLFSFVPNSGGNDVRDARTHVALRFFFSMHIESDANSYSHTECGMSFYLSNLMSAVESVALFSILGARIFHNFTEHVHTYIGILGFCSILFCRLYIFAIGVPRTLVVSTPFGLKCALNNVKTIFGCCIFGC